MSKTVRFTLELHRNNPRIGRAYSCGFFYFLGVIMDWNGLHRRNDSIAPLPQPPVNLQSPLSERLHAVPSSALIEITARELRGGGMEHHGTSWNNVTMTSMTSI